MAPEERARPSGSPPIGEKTPGDGEGKGAAARRTPNQGKLTEHCQECDQADARDQPGAGTVDVPTSRKQERTAPRCLCGKPSAAPSETVR